MRVLVTGASGHIASAVIPELLSHGHDVVGLARSDAAAAAVAALGADVHLGDLSDLDGLAAAARGTDGVIHLAFDHALMQSGRMEEAVAKDLEAVKAVGGALAGTGKPLVGTSGTLMLAMAGSRAGPAPRTTVAQTIAARLGLEAKSVTPEQAPQYLGYLAQFAQLDGAASNARTRRLLGWEPARPGWVEDVTRGHYAA